MEKKLTKKDFYAAIRTMVEGVDTVGEIPADEVLAFIDKAVEQIDNKAAKAKEKAAEKKADGDALRETVLANVTDEFQTAEAITRAIGDDEISKAKVVARLTQLVNAGLVKKEQMKVSDSKLMCYALADAE